MSSGEQFFDSFDEVGSFLRELCREGRFGTLFITTSDNKSASISLLGGEIVGATFRLLRGRDALVLIKNIGLSRCSFDEGKVSDTDPNLPPTHDILAMLGAHEPTAPPPPPPEARPAGPDVKKIRQILETELVEFLGPMAKIICSEHLERAGSLSTAAELTRLVDGLAGEITDRNQAEAFKRSTWDRLPG